MSEEKFRPYVPETTKMTEFTLRAVLLGLIMTVILGAANAYLGLRAGMTIAATYPAAVISMAILRLFRGSILEENIARTVGSIGESVAAGAIFTIPAFVIAKAWPSFDFEHAYWKSSALMLVGGVLGILFVTLLRRVMVEDTELPFPESVAASEIHKAGQRGSQAAKILFYNMAIGAAVYFLGAIKLFAASKEFLLHIGQIGKSVIRLGSGTEATTIGVGGVTAASAPAISPAYLGVGYIIGPRLAALNFSGGVLAWGLLVPLFIYFLGPQLRETLPPGAADNSWLGLANAIWRFIVRPIAVGGMLVGASFTLFRMRKSLAIGMKRAVSDLKKSGAQAEASSRTERDLGAKTVFLGLGATLLCMIALYTYFAGVLSGGIVAAVVMIILGFFFAAVSGNLVGMIGSSNNPISGLTLSTLIVAALLMVTIGVSGISGVAAVLGVAAVVCVSSAVAGEMLQDLKVGHILGGTPRSMQIGDFLGVFVASLLLYFPLLVLHQGNINAGGIGFGDRQLSAPQAGLMASLAQGIVGGDMPWPLVVVGIMMGFTLIMVQVRSPMLFAVGMYLPLETTFAIFLGGIIRWITDRARNKRGTATQSLRTYALLIGSAVGITIAYTAIPAAGGLSYLLRALVIVLTPLLVVWLTRLLAGHGGDFNDAQKARIENAGVLTASGLIAGEAMMGLVVATFRFFGWPLPEIFAEPSIWAGFVVLLLLAALMIKVPLANAGRPDEPAPPTAMM